MADEYIRRQDMVEECGEWYVEEGTEEGFIGTVSQMLDMFSPADVAPVVRCKDCKHYYFADNRIPQEQRYVCEISGEIWKPDSFCSHGERKE